MRYTIDYEESGGILACRMYGRLTEETSIVWGTDLMAALADARARSGTLRVLMDNREGHVAAPNIAKDLSARFSALVRPGDRSAILVPNSLNKIQARASATSEHEIFVSENAARIWLLAYSERSGVAA